MTLQEFITKYKGQKVDFDGVYGGQCFDLYRQYVKEVLNLPQSKPTRDSGAASLWTDFDSDPILVDNYNKVENTADFIPNPGDIAIWNRRMGGGYGHVAICTGKGDLNTFESFDQNWSKISYCELVTHTYSSFYGVLRPKVLSSTDSMQSDLQEVLDHYSVKTKEELISMIDEQLKFLKDERDKTNRLQEQIDSLKADNANYKSEASSRKQELDKFIEELAKRMFLPATSDKSDVIAGVDRLLTVEDQLTTAKKQLIQEEKKHDSEKSEMQKEIDELRASLEKQADENKTLLGRIENLEKRLNSNEEASSTTNKWKEFIDALLKIFKKG